MNDIARVISQLERQRATIDRALAALREVEGLAVAGGALAHHAIVSRRGLAQPSKKQVSSRGSEAEVTPEFTGKKAEFIRALIESRASSGVTPREIAEVFTARRIERGKNLITKTLNKLLNGKQLKRQGGRYFPASRSSAKSQPQKKRRFSPEGLKRIIAANKRRAAKQAGPVQAKKVPAKKAARTAA